VFDANTYGGDARIDNVPPGHKRLISYAIDLQVQVNAMGEIPKGVREALVKAFSLKSAMLDTERQMQERQQQLAEIRQDQQRVRENMATVNQTSQYYTRLLTKLNDQETDIEKLHGELEQFTRTYERQRKELETYLMSTTVG